MNNSKKNDPRFWRRWQASGAIRKPTNLVSEEVLFRRARAEGIDISKICVIGPRWAETRPLRKGVKSALVRCDLILRSDGSAVALDGAMGFDSLALMEMHGKGSANPNNLSWDEYVKSLIVLPGGQPVERN